MNRNDRQAARDALQSVLEGARPGPRGPRRPQPPPNAPPRRQVLAVNRQVLEAMVTALDAAETELETTVAAGGELEALRSENVRLTEVIERARPRYEAAIDEAFERRSLAQRDALAAAGRALDERERVIARRERDLGIPPQPGSPVRRPEDVFQETLDRRRQEEADRDDVRVILPG